jgi:site-specific DNA recombinase
VGEIKKGRYVYYHCTGYRGKCLEPYTREEVLAERFGQLLKRLSFDDEVMAWVREALRQSHDDEKLEHGAAIAREQAEYNRLQSRIDAMYVDKLDRRIDAAFFDRKAAEWRQEQARCLRAIEQHQAANQSYITEGIQLLELARNAHRLFLSQSPHEKRRLLDFVLSNCAWKDGQLSATYRQPFEMLAIPAAAHAKQKAAGGHSNGLSEIWLPGRDSNPRPSG